MSNAELNSLKKQMVIKLGTTTNDESAIISNMVDGASAGALPAVSTDDNGKVLKVVDGVWTKAEGGGGGSSDFTVAKLTFTTSNPVAVTGPMTTSVEGVDASTTETSFSSDSELDIILYKGRAILYISPLGNASIGTISGNITNTEEQEYVMTGDANVEIVGGSD